MWQEPEMLRKGGKERLTRMLSTRGVFNLPPKGMARARATQIRNKLLGFF